MKRYHVTFWNGENWRGETVVQAWTLAGAMKKVKAMKAIYDADRVAVRHGAECKVSSC